ncbi:MAG TPA: hypothetical protein VF831_10000, partial [Anaerolineales bacterium]
MANPNSTQIQIPHFIEHARQGTYYTIPFSMPEGTETFSLSYQYERHLKGQVVLEPGSFTSRQETNVIDLGLIAPDGS